MRKVHIVTYTHWDREFRWEFERTRMRLVDLFDHLFEIMEKKPDYCSFLCDGQLTLIEDYLEIRPEMKDEVRRYVREGRLEIGPWFTLPDCAPIQGESVVRNIQYGVKKCAEFGKSLKCGYNVFSFGQIGQLPQIYADFDIDNIVFYKYMDPSKSKYHEFIWEAPDGTRAYASHLGPEARWNFFFAGHIPIVYTRTPGTSVGNTHGENSVRSFTRQTPTITAGSMIYSIPRHRSILRTSAWEWNER